MPTQPLDPPKPQSQRESGEAEPRGGHLSHPSVSGAALGPCSSSVREEGTSLSRGSPAHFLLLIQSTTIARSLV